MLVVWLLCFPHLLLDLLSPWSTSCQRLLKHPPASKLTLLAKGCWRRQRDFTKPSKKTPKNVGMKLCDQLCGKLSARNRLKLLWRFWDGDEGRARQEAPGGRVSSTLSPAQAIVLCSTPTIVWAEPSASAFASNFLLFVGSHPGDGCLKHGFYYGASRKETPAP